MQGTFASITENHTVSRLTVRTGSMDGITPYSIIEAERNAKIKPLDNADEIE